MFIKKLNQRQIQNKGFTLLEVILYIGLLSIILTAIVSFSSMFVESRIKSQAIAEVEQQGLQTMQLITQTIRNAENITSPTTGSSAASLTLDVVTAGDDPTIFDLSGNAIRIKEGVGPNVNLTSARITASNLNFQNLSRASTPGIIRVSFTLTHVNPNGRNEYNYSKTFYASASLR